MAKRKPLTKKARFEVFKRDGFVCQYCGNHPPSVILEVDHIEPVSKGGTNLIDNLVTACFDCNRGKAGELLTTAPKTVSEKAAAIKEAEEQLRAYREILNQKRDREDYDIDELEDFFCATHTQFHFSSNFKESIRHNFLPYLSSDQLRFAMSISLERIRGAEKVLKYFCGVCWRLRRDVENG